MSNGWTNRDACKLYAWSAADRILRGGRNKDRRTVGNNTVLERLSEDQIGLRLHSTIILTWTRASEDVPGYITYHSGGWHTVTTKARLNAWGPLNIYSDRGSWCFDLHGERHVYQDGMSWHPDGTVTDDGGPDQIARDRKIRAAIKAYVAVYIMALDRGEIAAPIGGDCLYCALRDTKTNKPIGDHRPDHILSHLGLDECGEGVYLVPSLIVNAISEGTSYYDQQYVQRRLGAGGAVIDQYPDDVCRGQVTRRLRRYLAQQVGLQA